MKKNSLIIGTTQLETPFLNEGELPECARLNRKRTLASREGGGNDAGSSSLQAEEDRLLAEALAESQKDSSTGGGS